jgi:hypothetical protein
MNDVLTDIETIDRVIDAIKSNQRAQAILRLSSLRDTKASIVEDFEKDFEINFKIMAENG